MSMKEAADWLRRRTPTWTDQDRHRWLSTFHSVLVPLCLVSFVWLQSAPARFVILCLQVVTVVTEFLFRDCLITMVEKELSDETWEDFPEKIFKSGGWELTRPEKMSFNIGLNVGVLVVFMLTLLRESILWMVGFTSIAVTALPSLVLLSRTPRSPSFSGSPLPQSSS